MDYFFGIFLTTTRSNDVSLGKHYYGAATPY